MRCPLGGDRGHTQRAGPVASADHFPGIRLAPSPSVDSVHIHVHVENDEYYLISALIYERIRYTYATIEQAKEADREGFTVPAVCRACFALNWPTELGLPADCPKVSKLKFTLRRSGRLSVRLAGHTICNLYVGKNRKSKIDIY